MITLQAMSTLQAMTALPIMAGLWGNITQGTSNGDYGQILIKMASVGVSVVKTGKFSHQLSTFHVSVIYQGSV